MKSQKGNIIAPNYFTFLEAPIIFSWTVCSGLDIIWKLLYAWFQAFNVHTIDLIHIESPTNTIIFSMFYKHNIIINYDWLIQVSGYLWVQNGQLI